MTRMTTLERTRAVEPVLAMAKRAAALIARIYEGPFEVSYKSKNDPVTNADREANALLCAALAGSTAWPYPCRTRSTTAGIDSISCATRI